MNGTKTAHPWSLIALWLLLAGSVTSSLRQPATWHTDAAFDRQLRTPLSLSWTAMPLRRGLRDLARNQQVAIYLDRRVDPGQLVRLSVIDTSLGDALQELAESRKLGVSILAAVVYVGPPETAARLATVAAIRRQEATTLPPRTRARWQNTEPWHWQRLASPRQLLEALAEGERFRVENPSAIPHDLWPETSLPPLSLCDRLSLFLAGFELTFSFTARGSGVQLVPMPQSAAIRRAYRPQGNLRATARNLRDLFPQMDVQPRGDHLQLIGSYEEHQRFEQWLEGVPRRRPAPRREREKRYTLEVADAPANAVLGAIAKQLQLTLERSPGASENLNRRISFRVQNATLGELLHAALDPVNLTYELKDQTLIVSPATRD